jgi:hypothetical protein
VCGHPDARRALGYNAVVRRLALLVLVAACTRGGDGAPPCPSVAARFFQIARDELATADVDDHTRRAVADQLPAMRDALAQACNEGKWPAAIRGCLADAANRAAFETCEAGLDATARAALERAAAGSAASSE